jgi:hypothetical protein
VVFEDGEASHARNRLLEELDALWVEIAGDDRHAGEVPPWARQARDKSLRDGIADDEHDRDRGRRPLGRPRRWASVRHEDLHLEPDEISGELGVPLGSPARVPLLDREIAALDPPEFLQPLPKRIDGIRTGLGRQPPDPGRGGLLRLDGERHGEEAQGDGTKELPAVHY